jgi:ubiquinol-cytochrome c reductase cytochrome b subunit
MIGRILRWFDDRLGAASFARRTLNKAFPDHWSFMLGEIALYCFVILVLTGVFLTFFFTASGREVVYDGPYAPLRGTEMSAAYESVLRLSFEVRAGMVMRQIHHWAALVFVAAIVVHMSRIFFTGAFRRPREINWIVGVSLLLLAMAAGFTGYSLPDDLLSGTGVRIAYSILLSIPFVGSWAAFLVVGGEFPTTDLIGRLFVMHVMLIPGLIVAALSVHLALVWHQKHTQFRGPGRTEDTVTGSPLWPNYALKSVGLAFVVFAVLAAMGGLFQVNPVWLYGPFDPTTVASPAQPDWYLGWLEGALRLAPAWEIRLFDHTVAEPFLPGVLFPAVFFAGILLWPFIERRLTGDRAEHHLLDRPRDAPWRTGLGVGVLAFAGVLTLAGSNDVLSVFFSVPVETITRSFRVAVLVLPPVAGYVAYRVARDLRERELHPVLGARRAVLMRTATGGFREVEEEPPGLRSALAHQAEDGPDGYGHPDQEQPHAVHQPGQREQGSGGEHDGPGAPKRKRARRLLIGLLAVTGVGAILRRVRAARAQGKPRRH